LAGAVPLKGVSVGGVLGVVEAGFVAVGYVAN
jgi:hypothetical protein